MRINSDSCGGGGGLTKREKMAEWGGENGDDDGDRGQNVEKYGCDDHFDDVIRLGHCGCRMVWEGRGWCGREGDGCI